VELSQLIERLGGRFVLSFPSTVEPDVWWALSLGLFKGYRAAQNAAGWVVSVRLGDSNEREQRDAADDQAGDQGKVVVEKTMQRGFTACFPTLSLVSDDHHHFSSTLSPIKVH
jgi:hypothetical protein